MKKTLAVLVVLSALAAACQNGGSATPDPGAKPASATPSAAAATPSGRPMPSAKASGGGGGGW
jgi:hypothetical protein